MYKLIIQDDEGKTTVVPLIREELTIGREQGNTIRLTERNVSRHHARLQRSSNEIHIEDLSSYNGIRVNGTRITGKIEIKESDRVQIGDYLIEVKADQPIADVPTEQLSEPIPTVSASESPTVPTAVLKSNTDDIPSGLDGGDNPTPKSSDALVAPVPHISNHARLVVLSTNMAGQEYDLDLPAMVIGRTEENDVWVNHRSISRHHAKIVQENDSYAIVDLQSANGVRVNGEEYGKVELRAGDVIDLGHVRMRFVAPNEDFVFGRDAQAVDLESGKSRGMGLWIGLFLLLGVATTAFVVFRDSGVAEPNHSPSSEKVVVPEVVDVLDGKKGLVADDEIKNVVPDEEGIDEGTVEQDTVVPNDIVPVPDSETAEEVVPDDKILQSYLEEAIVAHQIGDWSKMAASAKLALVLAPENSKARKLEKLATYEKGNKQRFLRFEQSIKQRNFTKIAASFAKIPSDSIYKKKAEADHGRLKSSFRRTQLLLAQKYARRGKCPEIERLISRLPPAWIGLSKSISATMNTAECKDASVLPTEVDGGAAMSPIEEPQLSADALAAEGKKAVIGKQFGKGLKLCQQALAKEPGHEQAINICVISACKLKKSTIAKKYIRKIKLAARRSDMRQLCVLAEAPGFEEEP